jgi:hypothetical protein
MARVLSTLPDQNSVFTVKLDLRGIRSPGYIAMRDLDRELSRVEKYGACLMDIKLPWQGWVLRRGRDPETALEIAREYLACARLSNVYIEFVDSR